MTKRGFYSGLFELFEWITSLAYLNILWLAFTILGVGFLGIFPSTIAMFSVTRKWVQGEGDRSIFKLFWSTYRKEFLKSQVYGYFLVLIGVWLVFDLKFFLHQQGTAFLILRVISLALLIVYLLVLFYLFPMYVHFQMKFYQYLKYAFTIGFAYPLYTLLIAIGIFVLGYFSFKFTGVIAVWSGSLLALWISFITHQVFKKVTYSFNTEN